MQIFKETQAGLEKLNLRIHSLDFNRPWGGFFVIDEGDAQKVFRHILQ